MKITFFCRSALLPLFAFLSLSAAASAATLAISSGGPGMRMADNFGIPSDTGGYVIIAGTFATDPFTGGEAQLFELLGSFQEFGRTTSPIIGPGKGLISGVIVGGDPTGALGGKSIYLMVGDKATIQESTSVVLLKSTADVWRFEQDLNLPVAITSVVLGRNMPISVLGGFVDPAANADSAAVILPAGLSVPEPGACLLGLLGAMSVFARRRR